jgi:hypothetical protein
MIAAAVLAVSLDYRDRLNPRKAIVSFNLAGCRHLQMTSLAPMRLFHVKQRQPVAEVAFRRASRRK